MSARAELILDDLYRRGVCLSRNGNKLRVKAPTAMLTDDFLGDLRGYKTELLNELNAPATRDRLVKIANAEGIDLALIQRLPNDEIDACIGCSTEVLTAYVSALRDTDLRVHGLIPADETAIAVCRHCGPIWTHPQVAAIAPQVDGIPYVLGCPWCHLRDRSVVPHPTLPGIEP